MTSRNGRRILVIRRDNIGDLVCTTPLFQALRQHYPDALICALVNSYNRPVLDGNPYIDEIFAYTKAKHRRHDETLLSVYWSRFMQMRRIRKLAFDYIIIATSEHQPRTLALARWFRPRHIVRYTGPTEAPTEFLLNPEQAEGRNEVERVFALLTPFGIEDAPPAPKIFAQPDALTRALGACVEKLGGRPVVGIHISARKPSQRWPAERFAELMRSLHERHDCGFMLFWAPGDPDNPLHPGDDPKAQAILAAAGNLPILPWPTANLPELIAGLAACGRVVLADGGTMHLAAGLSKPIVCLFGNSDATRWAPWGVPYRLLQKPSRDVVDISVAEVADCYEALASIRSIR